MEPVAAIKLAASVFGLAHKFRAFAKTEPLALTVAVKEDYRELVVEHEQWLQHVMQRLLDCGERDDVLAARLDAFADDRQAQRVVHGLFFEAMREALDDRRRMLAAAAAVLTVPDLPVEEKARCERTLRQLDVADVAWLDVLDKICGNIHNGRAYGDDAALRHEVWNNSPSKEALVAAGCVAVSYTAGAGGGQALAHITRTGGSFACFGSSSSRSRRYLIPFLEDRYFRSLARSRDAAFAFVDSAIPALRLERRSV